MTFLCIPDDYSWKIVVPRVQNLQQSSSRVKKWPTSTRLRRAESDANDMIRVPGQPEWKLDRCRGRDLIEIIVPGPYTAG
jgi:hypothetical protein